MASTEAPISITVKTPAGSLITVRAEHGDELDQTVATALEAIRSAVTELESVARGGTPSQTMTPAQVATVLGGNIIETPAPVTDYAHPAQTPSPDISGTSPNEIAEHLD